MATKAQERRDALKDRLIDLAETWIEERGIDAIKARPLAQAAECSVGAIYNAVGDLETLVIAVNGRTFRKLGQHVASVLEGRAGDPPTERMVTIAFAYLDFAAAHPRLWRALFDLKMSADMDIPQWYREELAQLFGFIDGPVAECFPNKSRQEVMLMTRTLFSSVHGIVWLGLENRISGVPQDQLRAMIDTLIRAATQN